MLVFPQEVLEIWHSLDFKIKSKKESSADAIILMSYYMQYSKQARKI